MARAILLDFTASAEETQFSVQVGAFSHPANAQRLLESLQHAGYQGTIVPVTVGDVRLSAVRVGEFAREDEAVALRDELQDEMGLQGRVVSE